MRRLVIFGAGGFAEMAHYYFEHDSPYSVAAFTVDAAYIAEATFQGLPVIAFEELEASFPPSQAKLFVAMGIQKVNQQRAGKVAEAEGRGYELASFLSSKSHVADDLVMKPNSFVMEHSILLPKVSIGRDSILWARSSIGFGTRIGDHCWLVAPTLGAGVIVGDFSFIGLNATIAPHKTVGHSNVIGAGAVVLEDTKDSAVYKAQASVVSRVPSHRLRRI